MDAGAGARMSTAATLRDVAGLVAAGFVSELERPALEAVAARYAVAVTPAIAALVDPADARDPIARQFVPTAAELDSAPGETADPTGDDVHSPVKGLVHRYRDRALLKPLHTCPVYCRFCFRRARVGPEGEGVLTEAELDAALGYVADHPEIFELIVSGGDPLMLSPRRMAAIADGAARIPHLGVLRWHSRVPLVDPARVNAARVAALKRFPGAVFVAVHANHPREFTPQGRAALARLADAGIALVSQSVLLRGVNDSVAVLEALMRAFVANRVKPYYLHQGDPAPGTAHFRTTIAEGRALMRELRGRLSGLAQPMYVVDLPGSDGKVPLGPAHDGQDPSE